MKEQEKKPVLMDYEKPDLEIIEFELQESITASSLSGYTTMCGEEIY